MRHLIPFLMLCLGAIAVADEPKPAAKKAAAGGGKAKCVVYVSVGGENRIAAYAMDGTTGKLSVLASSDVGGAPGSLALHPSRRFLYAAIRTSGSVATLRIDPESGRLTPLDVAPMPGNPVYVTTDRAGKFLLTAYYGDAKAAVHAIAPDGAVRGEAIQVLLTGKNPHSINVDPSSRNVYVPNTGSDRILQFRLNEKAGFLMPLTTPGVETTPGTGPRHMCFHFTGDFAYAVNEKSSSVTVFRRHRETGMLGELQTLSTLPPGFKGMNTCADVEITPSGEHLYALNRGHDSLARFSVDRKTGMLSPLGQTPTEKTPREFAIDPSGQFLYAAGQDSGKLAAYKIDASNGQLAEVETQPVGKAPAWVLVVPLPK